MKDTAKADRRTLHFANINALLREVDRIAAADRAGKLRRTGNWTAGQALNHLATWIDYGYDGYPMGRPPFFIRWLIQRKGRQYLRSGMDAGVRIPGVDGGTYAVEDVPTDEAADHLRRSLARLKSGEPCPHDSPILGPASHADRIALNLRHAELHLGFLHP